ncbi:MAG TPA: Grx4 family monothiol glutaredoxin, partial [Pseudomonadota bacterium]|nr:Grx4 family monothiol glutaredoxin [Pseudomonadota bacterium]
MALSPDTRSQIETLLRQHTIVLFMKGSRQMPRCGFSAKVIEILEGHGIDYRDVDVLSDPALREGIKEFSNWPTIPQLFFQGSLIGGSDIVRQLDESGELLQALGIDPSKVSIEPPRISITPEAAAAIKDAGKEAEPGQHLRMVLSRGGQNIDLYFDAAKASDLRVEQHGITVLFDRASARLASGISIAYVDGPGGGFRIDNPNLPAQVGTLTPAELRKMMDAKVPLRLIDVRTERERAIARILPDVTLDQIAPEL